MKCEPNLAIASILRARLYKVVSGEAKSGSMIDLLGCSIDEFREYLEAQFEVGMTWDNHGEWHVDHRRPCNSFDLLSEVEQRMCFHYTNLQPMWALENLSKSDKYDEEYFPWFWDGSQWKEKV
jgi:hypothetical protein